MPSSASPQERHETTAPQLQSMPERDQTQQHPPPLPSPEMAHFEIAQPSPTQHLFEPITYAQSPLPTAEQPPCNSPEDEPSSQWDDIVALLMKSAESSGLFTQESNPAASNPQQERQSTQTSIPQVHFQNQYGSVQTVESGQERLTGYCDAPNDAPVVQDQVRMPLAPVNFNFHFY